MLQVGPGVLAHILGGGDGTFFQLHFSPVEFRTPTGRHAARHCRPHCFNNSSPTANTVPHTTERRTHGLNTADTVPSGCKTINLTLLISVGPEETSRLYQMLLNTSSAVSEQLTFSGRERSVVTLTLPTSALGEHPNMTSMVCEKTISTHIVLHSLPYG